MRVYGDSSFLIRLVLPASDMQEAMATYRRAGRPRLFYLPLHELEVCNGILARAFFDAETGGPKARAEALRMKEAAFGRLEKMLDRKLFLKTSFDWDEAMAEAKRLALRHTESFGPRAIDVLHVAFALRMGVDLFITADHRQAKLARLEGLETNAGFAE